MDFLKPKETPKGANIGKGEQTPGIIQQPDVPNWMWLGKTPPLDNKPNLNIVPPGGKAKK